MKETGIQKSDMQSVLKSLVEIQMAFDRFAFDEAEQKVNRLALDIQRHFKIEDSEMIEDGIPVCFCLDERGWSTCGAECPRHPPKYYCLCQNKDCKGCTSGRIGGCARKVAYGRVCFLCSGGDDDERHINPRVKS